MAYATNEQFAVAQGLAEVSTTKKMPLGSVVKGVDPDMGEGDFIYVQASNSVTQYDAVAIKSGYKIAPLTITNGKTAVEIGFAQTAVGAKDSYAFVQKNGTPVVRLALATQANMTLFASSTGGVLTSASTSVMIGGVAALTEATNSANPKTCTARYPVAVNAKFA